VNKVADLKARKIELEYDKELWISTANNLKSKDWKNKEVKWSQILSKLTEDACKNTGETIAEFMKMSKEEQGRIKDVGGFVGGRLSGGRRIKENVAARDILTFDLDFAPQNFLAWCYTELPYAWALYSTHKHTPDKPRFRLLLPLDREVSPDEYQAIGRKIAEDIGLSYMDPTTFEAHRLMFWPSCPADVKYEFKYNDDEFLKADDVLSRYPDWRDQSYWPVCPTEEKARKDAVKKQQNPLEKQNMVGAFCRCYTVPEVIDEYLSDVYEPCDTQPNRYTYKQGTTAAGLVIYDDGLFCYSNHSTDPASGQDLNAFDLVRVHRFRELDEDAKEGTRVDRLPSYQAMCELASEDKKVRRLLREKRRESTKEAFAGEYAEEDPETGESWEDQLEVHKKTGEVLNTVQNLKKILLNDKNLQGLAKNAMDKLIHITKPLPWNKELGTWSDDDSDSLYVYLSDQYTNFKRNDIESVLEDVAKKRLYHPIKDYLNGLPEWDGTSRAKQIFIDYLGAEDCEYVRETTALWLTAAVARIYEPGCKFDNVIVLSGAMGIGKSTLLDKLGGDWFSDNLTFEDMKSKEGAEKLQCNWIMEIAELKGMRKVDVESVKSFISRREDRFRPSYGKHQVRRPRACVFIGTSNAGTYLKDITGNRRFWPITCGGTSRLKAWHMKKEDRDQIWAEVKQVFYDELYGNKLVLSKKLEKELIKKQTEALEGAEQEGDIELYLERLLPENWNELDIPDRIDWLGSEKKGTVERTRVCVAEIWSECFHMSSIRRRRTDSEEIIRTLLRLGWEDMGVQRVPLYGHQLCFCRVSNK
jgi:predicted P-loop ATPase